MKRRKFFTQVLSLGSLGLAACNRAKVADSPLGQDVPFTVADLPLPDGEPLLRFASIADTGTGTTAQYDLAAVMATYHERHAYPLVIMAGDNIYNVGAMRRIAQVFERPYQALRDRGVRFQAILGNHDIWTANGVPQTEYAEFNMQGRRYYTFTEGPVQWFALDTNSNADWAQQLPWLQQQLAQSEAPWKVVFGHHQIYSSGVYGVNESRWAARLKELFAQYGVQLYVNGHEHHYERTHTIAGTTYVISGAGAKLRPVGRSTWTAHAASRLSFAVYDVFADQIVVRGIGTDGEVFDQGVISRTV